MNKHINHLNLPYYYEDGVTRRHDRITVFYALTEPKVKKDINKLSFTTDCYIKTKNNNRDTFRLIH